MLRFGMPTLIELNRLEDTMKLCKKLNLDFFELNMNLPQFQIEYLDAFYATGTKSLFV